jgi:hypothetical protein
MRKGDVSRRRRLIGPPAKLRWYAHYRSLRFARRFGFAGNGRNKQPQMWPNAVLPFCFTNNGPGSPTGPRRFLCVVRREDSRWSPCRP